jgi:small subunit ribosomal protein S21
MQVKLRKNETVDNLIKRFMRKTKNEKITEEVLKKQYYKKPSVQKREAYFRRLKVLEKIKRKEAQERDD